MVQPTRLLSMDNMPLFPFILFFFVLKTEITLIRYRNNKKKCKAMVQIARVSPILHLAFKAWHGTAAVAAPTAFFLCFSIHYHIKTSMKLSSLQFRIFQSNPLLCTSLLWFLVDYYNIWPEIFVQWLSEPEVEEAIVIIKLCVFEIIFLK